MEYTMGTTVGAQGGGCSQWSQHDGGMWCYTRFGQYTSPETTAIDYLASPGSFSVDSIELRFL